VRIIVQELGAAVTIGPVRRNIFHHAVRLEGLDQQTGRRRLPGRIELLVQAHHYFF